MKLDPNVILSGLKTAVECKDLFMEIANAELNLPNLKLPTMGGKRHWMTIGEYNGYRIQQNDLTKHARILNPDNVRIAWGTISGMEMVLKRLSEHEASSDYEKSENTSESRLNIMQDIKSLKELLDMGAITQDEYNSKKAKLLNKL